MSPPDPVSEPPISRAKQIPWARVFVEGAVIVVSILLALAADAWWESSQNAQEEELILEDLRGEFELHQAELNRLLTETERRRAAAEELLAWMNGGPDLPFAALDSLWGSLITTTGFDPATGVYDAVVGAGRLDLIENPAIRNALAAWPHEVEEVVSSEQGVRSIVLNSLVPALADAGAPVSRALAALPSYEWSAALPGAERAAEDYTRLRAARDVESLVAYRYSWTTGLKGDYEEAQVAVAEMIELLDFELQR